MKLLENNGTYTFVVSPKDSQQTMKKVVGTGKAVAKGLLDVGIGVSYSIGNTLSEIRNTWSEE